MKTLDEKKKELTIACVDIKTVDDLQKAFDLNLDSWKIIKDVYFDEMYSIWAKSQNLNQYHHQLTYNKIIKLTDEEVLSDLKKTFVKKVP